MFDQSFREENQRRPTQGTTIVDNLGGAMRENLCRIDVDIFSSFFGERSFHNPFENVKWVNEEDLSKIKIINLGNLLMSGVFLKIKGNLGPLLSAMYHSILMVYLKNKSLKLYCMHFFYHLVKIMSCENGIFNRPEMQEMEY